MKIYTSSIVTTLFGDASLSCNPASFCNMTNTAVLHDFSFNTIKKITKTSLIIFPHQIHGAEGLTISTIHQAQSLPLFTHPSDFLVTKLKNVALGIVTADCLPIIAIDPITKSIGIAHAGWRGSAANIAKIMIETMHSEYGSQPHNIIIQFGPSAGHCCYEVQPSFIEQLNDQKIYTPLIQQSAQKSSTTRQNKLYFNLVLFNNLLLKAAGIASNNIDSSNHVCTICTPNYISVRRGRTPMRQITVASLK